MSSEKPDQAEFLKFAYTQSLADSIKMYAYLYTFKSFFLAPLGNTATRILAYAKTDAKETPAEAEAFDILEDRLLIAIAAMRIAKKEGKNRRSIAYNLFGLLPAERLSVAENNIIIKATQAVARNDYEVKHRV